MKKHAAPIIAAVLLLLLLYVGSFFALVVPEGRISVHGHLSGVSSLERYRLGGSAARFVYAPLESVDRAIRPGAWKKWPPEWDES
jgi:hypothetical protein